MHLAMIIDEERLLHEHPMLNRLSIGLLDSGLQLTRIVPDVVSSESIDAGEQRIALATRIEVPLKVLPWMRRLRARRLMEMTEKSVPDVIYAVGVGSWQIGSDLARALNRPLMIGVWSAPLVRRAPRPRRRSVLAGYVAPTEPIAQALRRRADPELVSLVPMGVAIPNQPRRVLAEPKESIAIAITGSGRDVPAYRALLGGLSRIAREMPQLHAVLELRGPNAHEIWRIAQKLELLGRVSTIEEATVHRPLINRCDMLLVPERYGELYSLVLECMAYGMPVVAADDPYLDMMIDEQTALLVDQDSADQWSRHIGRLVRSPEEARQLGLAGRRWVAEHHRSSEQVRLLIDTLDRIVHAGAYPFSPRDEPRPAQP